MEFHLRVSDTFLSIRDTIVYTHVEVIPNFSH